MLQMNIILHPTDFSIHSDRAFRLGCSLARDHGARLIVLHVAPPAVYGLAFAQTPEYDELWKKLHEIRVPELPIPLDYRLRYGHAVDEILRVAREAACDLIVMGTHGRSGFSRVLTGSVTEAVVRRAPCHTLAVKTPFPESVYMSEALTEAVVEQC
jgi:nucleotide-binding universal stress UspA family protein